MSKTMTKYQLDHFRDKVKRQFNPLIEEAELLVKQYKTEATDKAVDKLAKKMGADKIIKQFQEAEIKLEEARASALTFFTKKKPKGEELNYNFLGEPRLPFQRLIYETKVHPKIYLFLHNFYFGFPQGSLRKDLPQVLKLFRYSFN